MAQQLSGTLAGAPDVRSLILYDTRGSDHRPLDSAKVDGKGRFSFAQRKYLPGYYQLAASDSDRVDLILDPREREVVLHLGGTPLRAHIAIARSAENQRLWESKWMSRESQQRILAFLDARQAAGSPPARGQMDSIQEVERIRLQNAMDVLAQAAPNSHFAHILAADRALNLAVPLGADAIKRSVDWADARLVRSSVYPRALISYLQAVPVTTPQDLVFVCDSLLEWAAPDTMCWRYSRSFLLRLFTHYGPYEVADKLVERYVLGPKALLAAEPSLMEILRDQLRLARGSLAPDVALCDPLGKDTVQLRSVLVRHRYTALFYYSSTCDHCHDQMPGLREMYEVYGPKGFQVIGIALDDDSAEFRNMLEEKRIPWPSYTELNGWGSQAAKAFGVKATPWFYLLDTSGIILGKPEDQVELRTMLEQLMP